jgi:hypothetical protein
VVSMTCVSFWLLLQEVTPIGRGNQAPAQVPGSRGNQAPALALRKVILATPRRSRENEAFALALCIFDMAGSFLFKATRLEGVEKKRPAHFSARASKGSK